MTEEWTPPNANGDSFRVADIKVQIEDAFSKIDTKEAMRDIVQGLGIPPAFLEVRQGGVSEAALAYSVTPYTRPFEESVLRYQKQLNRLVDRMARPYVRVSVVKGRGAQRYWQRRLAFKRRKARRARARMLNQYGSPL